MDIFPDITPPYPTHIPTDASGLIYYLNIAIRLVFAVAGIFALWKFISAGFTFINSDGEPEKLANARGKITMTFVGMLVMFGSFALATLIGTLFFDDPMAILNPKITGPGP